MALSEPTEYALEACIDAVVAPALWPQALQLLAESLGAESCTFCSRELQQLSSLVMPISSGHEEFADLWLRNQDSAPDPHFVLGPRIPIRRYTAVVEDQITTADERKALPYYQETARPGNRDWWAISRFSVEGRWWCLPVYRGLERGPFTLAEAQNLAMVGPHVARVVALAEKFAAFQMTSELATLERMRCAALVVDTRGRVTNLNLLAQALLGEDFDLVRSRPVASNPVSNTQLQELISSSITAKRGDPSSHGPVVIDRDELPWLLVEAMPVTAFGSNLFNAGRVILLLTDLTSPPRPDAMTLRAAFGLTVAEARLAVRLASGKGIKETATALGITRATACSQLRAVFAKTNTQRQAELIGLITHLRTKGDGRATFNC